ncbi:unnamed protein product [Calypogeia fissa]
MQRDRSVHAWGSSIEVAMLIGGAFVSCMDWAACGEPFSAAIVEFDGSESIEDWLVHARLPHRFSIVCSLFTSLASTLESSFAPASVTMIPIFFEWGTTRSAFCLEFEVAKEWNLQPACNDNGATTTTASEDMEPSGRSGPGTRERAASEQQSQRHQSPLSNEGWQL